MSKTVDQRVVSLQFDNKHFESNVQTSMSTLDKLKQKLSFKDGTKGLDNLATSAKKVDMSHLSTGVENVSAKFSSLDVIGVTALANITNSAVEAGKRIVSALTIDPVRTGLSEYETKMNAIQVIRSNTKDKNTMEEIEEALAELNDYADRTIYNFAHMTSNVGKFVAQGMDVKKAVKAVQGMANLAGVSGASAEDMARATYQMSQALGGIIRKQDWNSLRNANMSNEILKKVITEVATLEGIDLASMIKKKGTFEETLESGWLTGDLFTEAMNMYSDAYTEAELKAKGYNQEQIKYFKDLAKQAQEATTEVKTMSQLWDVLKETAQSGWTQTWELIFGKFDDAKKLFTGMQVFFSDIIDRSSDFRNKIVEMVMGSPFGKMAETVRGMTDAAKSAVKPLKDYEEIVRRIMNGDFGNQWDNGDRNYRRKLVEAEGYNYDIAQTLVNQRYGINVKLTDDLTEAYGKQGDTVSDTIDKLVEYSDAQLVAKGYTEEQIRALRLLAKYAEAAGMPLSEFIKNLDEMTGREMLIESFKNAGKGLATVFKSMKDAWTDIFPITAEEIALKIYGAIVKLYNISKSWDISKDSDTIDKLTRTFKGLFAALDIILTVIGGPIKIAFKLLGQLLSVFDLNILDLTAIIGDAIVLFRDWLDSVLDFTGVFEWMAPYIKSAAKATRDWFVSLKDSAFIKSLVGHLKNAAAAVKNFFGNLKNSAALQTFWSYLKKTGAAIADWFKGIKDAENIPMYIIQGLANGLRNGASIVWNAMVQLVTGLIDKAREVLGIHSPSVVFAGIGGFIIAGLILGLTQGFPQLGETMKNLGSMIGDLLAKIDWGKVFVAVSSAITLAMGYKLVDAFNNLTKPIAGIGELLEELTVPIAKVVTGFARTLNAISFNVATEGIKNIAMSVLMIAAAIAIIVLVADDPDTLRQAVIVIGIFTAALLTVAFLMTKLESASLQINKSGASLSGLKPSLLAIGAAILLLGITAKIISSMNPEEAERAVWGVLGLVVALSAVLIVYGKFVKGKAAQNIDKAGKAIQKIAGSMLLLAILAKIIASMSWGDMGKAAVGILGLVGIVALVMLIANIGGRQVEKAGKAISKIATAMLLLVIVAKIIAGMSWGDMGKAAVGLVGLVGIVALLVLITKLAGSNTNKLGSTLLAISGSIAILVIVAQLVAAMTWESMGKAAVGLLGLVGVVALMVLIVKMVKSDAPKIAGTLLAIAGSVAILALVAILLGVVKPETLEQGLVAMGIILALVTMMAMVAKNNADCKNTMIGIAIAIGVMAAAVALLSFLDPADLAVATACMSALMGMLALVIKASDSAKTSIGVLITIAAVTAALAIVVYLLAQNEAVAKNALPAVAALSILMLALTAVLVVIDKVLGTVNLVDILLGVVGLLALCIPLLALVGILALMQGVDNATQSANALASLATVLTLLLIPLALIGTFGFTQALLGVVGLLAMCVPLLALVGILALMSNIEGAEKSTNLLIRLMTALTLMTTVLAIVGPLALAGASAAQSLLVLIGVMGAIALAVGALLEICPQLETFIDKGIDLFVKLSNGIGKMVGALIGGIAEGITASLPKIGTDLSNFMTNAKPFIDGAKSIDATAMEGVKSIADIILTLTGANILDSMTSWFTGGSSLSQFGLELATFAPCIKAYSDAIAGIDSSAVEASANAAKALAEMASTVPNAGGVASWFAGENSIAQFGAELIVLGGCLSTYSKTIAGFDSDAVIASAEAAKALADMAATVPNAGGVVSWFAGENSIAQFGNELIALGVGLSTYSSIISGFDGEAVIASANAAKALTDMASTIPNEGGIVAWFTGDNSIAQFGAELIALGIGLAGFAFAVKGIVPEEVIAAAEAAKALAEMADNVPNEGGIVSWFTGENSVAAFGDKLPQLGKGLKGFSDSVSGISPENVTAAANAAKALAEMTSIIPKEGGIQSWFTGDSSISKFAGELPSLGKALKGFSDSVAGIAPENVTAAANAAKAIAQMASESPKNADKLDKFGESIATFSTKATTYYSNMSKISADAIAAAGDVVKSIKSFAADIDASAAKKAASAIKEMATALQKAAKVESGAADGFANAMKNIAKTSVDAVIKAFSDSKTRLSDAGRDAISVLIKGAESRTSAATTAFKGVVDKCAKALNQTKSFESAGKNLGQGLINGIKAMETAVYNAAYALGQKAVQGEKDGQKSKSPSKLTMQAGKWFGEGLIIGIEKMDSQVYKAGYGLGNTATRSISSAVSKVADAINSDIDAQPTIRPVLDLSDVRAGANSINGMFGNRTMSIDTRTVMATAAAMSGYQNGGNPDVVSAIKGLRKDINNMPRNTYSVGDVTYDDGSEVANAVQALVRAARVERRS